MLFIEAVLLLKTRKEKGKTRVIVRRLFVAKKEIIVSFVGFKPFVSLLFLHQQRILPQI
jgi:hypothetical protein